MVTDTKCPYCNADTLPGDERCPQCLHSLMFREMPKVGKGDAIH
jgi:hypothetical protein